MLIRGVIGNPIDDDAQPQRMGFGQHRIERRHVTEDRVDIAVVADVIAEIGHRRSVERRDPERIDTKPRELSEMRTYALKVADPIAIRVSEGPGIDLVEDGLSPPSTCRARRLRAAVVLVHRQTVTAKHTTPMPSP